MSRRSEAPEKLYWGFVDAPFDPMLAVQSPAGLCALEFDGPKRRASLARRFERFFPEAEIAEAPAGVRRDPLGEIRNWLARYFAGKFPSPSGLALDMHGTPFELDVWNALLEIPPGRTRTYGELAERVGHPGSARAVGGAVGSNPLAIVVPCHRIIGANGSLTGFGGGIARKKWLLEHEHLATPEGRSAGKQMALWGG
ncbi:MAG: methylated-DNA--[protein]-cysteine S-methyltransferase [Candidatus Eiseniibacteriota bacterium]